MDEIFQCFSWNRRFETPDLEKSTKNEVLECLRALRPYEDKGTQLIRIGPRSDGGYLVPSALLTQIQSAVCIGVGSSDSIGFDLELARQGKHVYQYDHIVENYLPPPIDNGTLTFFEKGLSWKRTHNTTTLDEICLTLDLPKTGNLLKVDIEGDEFPSLFVSNEQVLSRFDVIVMELHWLRLVDFKPLCAIIKSVFDKLNEFHAIVHLHSNNIKRPFICQGIYFPNVLEVTWVRRDCTTNLLPNPYHVVHPEDVLSDPSKVEQHFPNPWCI